MAIKKTEILVYAHWQSMIEPKQIGILTALNSKGRISYNFEYNKEWINSNEQFLLYRLKSKLADIIHCIHISALLLSRHNTSSFEI